MHSEQLARVIETIADTLLCVPALRMQHAPRFEPDALVARIDYEGDDFQGSLTATFSDPLARALAGLMLGCSGHVCSDADARDAAGEIANIAAGNLRGLLSARCQLSLPKVTTLAHASERERMPLIARASFSIFDQPLHADLRGDEQG